MYITVILVQFSMQTSGFLSRKKKEALLLILWKQTKSVSKSSWTYEKASFRCNYKTYSEEYLRENMLKPSERGLQSMKDQLNTATTSAKVFYLLAFIWTKLDYLSVSESTA